MSTSKHQVVVVCSTDHPARHSLDHLLEEVASCEHLVFDELLDEVGNESQQIELDQIQKDQQALQDRLEELMHDRKYTGASHVFLLQGQNLTDPTGTHAAMLKALMEKSMTTDQEVIAVLLPEQVEVQSMDEAHENFEQAVASHEALLKPFPNIRVYTSLQRAAHQLGGF